MQDTDDEDDEDDEGENDHRTNSSASTSIVCLEMRDFIVDDDDENNNGFDYQKELRETLKTNFRFDPEK